MQHQATGRVYPFGVRVGLGPVPASRTDVLAEIGDRLNEYEPRLTERDADLELSLTIMAGDLWIAVLSAMAAVTSTGYQVVQLNAQALQPARPGAPVVTSWSRPSG